MIETWYQIDCTEANAGHNTASVSKFWYILSPEKDRFVSPETDWCVFGGVYCTRKNSRAHRSVVCWRAAQVNFWAHGSPVLGALHAEKFEAHGALKFLGEQLVL